MTAAGASERFARIEVGERLTPLSFPLPLHRLIMAAGATRDFSPMHHNDVFAVASGAPGAYANALLLMGMWERLVREYIGPGGTIQAIRDFRMVTFNVAGSVVHVEGQVVGKQWLEDTGQILIEVRSLVDGDLTVGPGTVRATV
jgi:acyl dehydratase